MSDLVERGTTVPVCCYCDAPLSCARCGCEQPADVAQASQDRIEALEAALRQIATLEDLPSSLSVARSIARGAALAPEQETAPVEEDDETIARRLAIIFHGDDVEWKGFLTKAHHWMSLSIDAADKRSQALECSSAESEIAKLRTVPKAKAAPNRVEIAMMVDPEAFIDAMLQDDLTPSERVYFDNNRQTDKLNALKKADDILAALSLSRIEALETALREIKQLALSCKPAETPAALAHMVRICIDAGITRAALAPEQDS